MDIISVRGPIATTEAAHALGLISYDCALPQGWLDHFVKVLRIFFIFSKDTIGEVEDLYGKVLSSFVWSYDKSLMGLPYPLTGLAYMYLKAFDTVEGTRYSDETPAHTFKVLDIWN